MRFVYFLIFEEMSTLIDNNKKDAETTREDLRYLLHVFSAMSLPIPISDLYTEFNDMLHATKVELEGLYRSGGELKRHLYTILEGLKSGHRSLMYRGNVDAMSLRVSLLVSATTLPTVLEPQGKSDLLEGLQDTSEKMRSASQTKLLKILPKVIRNIKKLIRCKNIPPNVILELKESCQLLDPNVEGLNDTASMTGSSRPVTAAASRPLTAVPTTGKKEKKASFVPLIDPTRLINIREGQRRIAALLFVSNLPTSTIEFLSTVEVAMQDQTAANVLVDDVVHEECELLLKLR